MSTKDLSRTVIEGGRDRYNTWERRSSHREERAHERAYLRAVEHDPSIADARSPEPRRPVRKAFHDRLAAAERWLLGHVGRPWRKVEGEILATFDTRTIAGRHVVFDHLLPSGRWPHEPGTISWSVRRRRFYVDTHGVLRAAPLRAWHGRLRFGPRDEVVRALAARRVIVRDERAYWLEPTGARYPDGTLAYRQTRELDARERAWWNALEDGERTFATTPAKLDPAPRRRSSGDRVPRATGERSWNESDRPLHQQHPRARRRRRERSSTGATRRFPIPRRSASTPTARSSGAMSEPPERHISAIRARSSTGT